MKKISELSKILIKEYGIMIHDLDLLTQAMTHSSFMEDQVVNNYERLEFLGDSILKACLSEWLYKEFDSLDEGDLTAIRIENENNEFLSEVEDNLHLEEFMRFGNSIDFERYPEFKQDVMEALVGVVFLEKGYLVTYEFVMQSILSNFDIDRRTNYVGYINEFLQKKYKKSVDIFSYEKDNNDWICNATFEDIGFSATAQSRDKAKKIVAKQICEEFDL